MIKILVNSPIYTKHKSVFVVNILSFETRRQFDSLTGRKVIAMLVNFSQPQAIWEKVHAQTKCVWRG